MQGGAQPSSRVCRVLAMHGHTLAPSIPSPREAPRQAVDASTTVALATTAFLLPFAIAAVFDLGAPLGGDGVFYVSGAKAIARGLGYVAIFPDGRVSPTAHFPVGYPFVLAKMIELVSERWALPMLAGFVSVCTSFAIF